MIQMRVRVEVYADTSGACQFRGGELAVPAPSERCVVRDVLAVADDQLGTKLLAVEDDAFWYVVAVNGEQATLNTSICDGDEVLVLPWPLVGG